MDAKRKSTLSDLERSIRVKKEKPTITTVLKSWIVSHFVPCDLTGYLLGLFPIVGTVRDYKPKTDLPNDVIAGLTSGVMMIPQGMAFAALSTLPPIVGLYISFFASVTYVIFGTGRQVSWGCIAILSLMMATILDEYDSQFPEYQLGMNGSDVMTGSGNSSLPGASEGPLSMSRRIQVASSVSFFAALVVIACSRLGLSRITCLMSNSFITGFTVGLSMHVFTSQLKGIFGVSVPRFKGPGNLIRTWVEVCIKLPETNVATLIISVLCILMIYLVKRFINEKFKHKLRIPIPIELVVLIAGTVSSHFGRFEDRFGVKVVKDVPTGIPSPQLPDFDSTKHFFGDALVIIFVAYAQTLAVAKTFGLKHGYPVDANQEMLACGLCNLVCSLFSGYITGGSVSRSVVQDGAGGKTQMASLIAAGLVLLVIMLIGPYFYHLPTCVLAAIIVVNLKGMFLKLLTIPDLWRKSKYDCLVWVVTFVATVVLNADLGLIVGVAFSVLLVLFRSFIASVVEVGQLPRASPATPADHGGLLRSVNNYPSVVTLGGVKIVKVKTPLYFINADKFTASLFDAIGVHPLEIKATLRRERERMENRGPGKSNPTFEDQTTSIRDIEIHVEAPSKGAGASEKGKLTKRKTGDGLSCVSCESNSREKKSVSAAQTPELGVKAVIVDLSSVSFLDLMGVEALEYVIVQLTSVEIETRIISIPENLFNILESSGFWKRHETRMMVDLEDALVDLSYLFDGSGVSREHSSETEATKM